MIPIKGTQLLSQSTLALEKIVGNYLLFLCIFSLQISVVVKRAIRKKIGFVCK
jgi:hypothetical protein